MLRKVSLMVGFGAGYVLGARAGRERYEEIVSLARDLAGSPQVSQAKESVVSGASSVGSAVLDQAKDTVEKIASNESETEAARAAAEGESGVGASTSAPTVSAGAPVKTTRTTPKAPAKSPTSPLGSSGTGTSSATSR